MTVIPTKYRFFSVEFVEEEFCQKIKNLIAINIEEMAPFKLGTKIFKWDRGYQLSSYIHTTILELIRCVEHKPAMTFETETPVRQSLVFKLLTLKIVTSKTYFL